LGGGKGEDTTMAGGQTLPWRTLGKNRKMEGWEGYDELGPKGSKTLGQ